MEFVPKGSLYIIHDTKRARFGKKAIITLSKMAYIENRGLRQACVPVMMIKVVRIMNMLTPTTSDCCV